MWWYYDCEYRVTLNEETDVVWRDQVLTWWIFVWYPTLCGWASSSCRGFSIPLLWRGPPVLLIHHSVLAAVVNYPTWMMWNRNVGAVRRC